VPSQHALPPQSTQCPLPSHVAPPQLPLHDLPEPQLHPSDVACPSAPTFTQLPLSHL
jgi:hypothetical protein